MKCIDELPESAGIATTYLNN